MFEGHAGTVKESRNKSMRNKSGFKARPMYGNVNCNTVLTVY